MSWLDNEKGKPITVNGVSMPDRKNLTITAPGATASDSDANNRTTVDFTGLTSPQYDSMTALRLVNPVDGRLVQSKGYSSPGDDGGGTWLGITGVAPATYSHNGGTVIVPSGGDGSAAWVRQFSGLASIKWFGATGNGSTDDTIAVHASFDWAHLNGRRLFIPVGDYRVTSGWSTSTNYRSLELTGEANDYESNAGQAGKISRFILDSTSSSSFFIDLNHRGAFSFENICFKCEQYVLDRDFIKLSFSGVYGRMVFEHLHFESVEHPFRLVTGSYMQSMVLRNIIFRNSGTIKSDGTALKVTGLILDNIAHSGSVPVATVPTVMDLRGCRQISGTVVILEGALPASGTWTILDAGDSYANYTRTPLGHIGNFWSEWSGGNIPLYVTRQAAGRLSVDYGTVIPSGATFRAEDHGLLRTTMTMDSRSISDAFSLEDTSCTVLMDQVVSRDTDSVFKLPGSTAPETAKILFNNCIVQRSSAAGEEVFGDTVFSNTGASQIWKFDGGYLDGEHAIFAGTGGTTYTPTTDTTHGRKLSITIPGTPSGFNAYLHFPLRNATEGHQYCLVIHGKAPTITSGDIPVKALQDSSDVGSICSLASEEEFMLTVPMSVLSGTTTTAGIRFGSSSLSGVTGTLDIYSMAFYLGHTVPRRQYSDHPKNVVTFNSAAPTTGTWVVGDVVRDSAPTAGGTAGWICTTAGTPGTWKTFGAISA